MIRKMKKITILTLESSKEQMLRDLRGLAVMHLSVDHTASSRGNAAVCTHLLEEIERDKVLLEDLHAEKTAKTSLTAPECLEKIRGILEKKSCVEKELEKLAPLKEQLLPWGSFSPEQVRTLAGQGVYVTLFRLPAKSQVPEQKDVVFTLVSADSVFKRYAAVSRNSCVQLPENADVMPLPEFSLTEVNQKIKACQKALENLHEEMLGLAGCRPLLAEYAASVRDDLRFAEAELSMTGAGKLTYLCGYVPEIRMEKFQQAARKNGWALLIEDPAPDDNDVPTYITKPEWLGIMDPLFDLIGVDPGYRENDVNAFFFVFFPIFFGMIIGDAGYGTLFILAVLAGKILLRNVEKARLPLNLFLLLSSCALIWGWLNGNWFGLPRECLPVFMGGLDFLNDPQNSPLAVSLVNRLHLLDGDMTEAQRQAVWSGLSNRFVQWFCFLLAALHLSSARLFKFIVTVRSDWRSWGNLGWMFLIIANFFMAVDLIVFSGTFPKTFGYSLYIAGFILVVVTVAPADAMNLPFSLIGSFTDVLSYIRLFAVGLSGSYIAANFNSMGHMLTEGRSGFVYVLAVIGMVLVALFGHVLNIALGFLSVMVHAIRLNTLEFSNHVGMQWAGIRYNPFAEKSTENKHKNNEPEISGQHKEI